MSLRSECLLAVTGVAPREITPRHMESAIGVPERWKRRLVRWLKEDQQPFVYVAPPDMEKAFDNLASKVAGVPMNAIAVALAIDPVQLADYVSDLLDARAYLLAAWPRLTIETSAGPELVGMSLESAQGMAAVYRTIDKPETLLDAMDECSLDPAMALAFRVCYPDLYKYVREILTLAIGERKASVKGWGPSWRHEAVLDVLHATDRGPIPPPAPIVPPEEGKKLGLADNSATQAALSDQPVGRDQI